MNQVVDTLWAHFKKTDNTFNIEKSKNIPKIETARKMVVQILGEILYDHVFILKLQQKSGKKIVLSFGILQRNTKK